LIPLWLVGVVILRDMVIVSGALVYNFRIERLEAEPTMVSKLNTVTQIVLVLAILFMLAGAFFAPLPIMAMGIFVALVQAFVFFLLSIMYFAGAMEEAH
jgi:phosphatidylglycerophosphate synthase